LEAGSLINSIYLRKHKDKFILSRNNPASIPNYHTTYTYGQDSQLNIPLNYGDLLLGVDTGADEIHSSNLGKHNRLRGAGFAGYTYELSDKLIFASRLRLDHYQGFREQESYNFGLNYQASDKWKIKSSVDRSFRVPSFTDLFYSDAANKGNPNLNIEKSDSYRMGLGFTQGSIDANLEGFLRRARNLIDWTRSLQSDPWQATNLGSVDFSGIEFSAKLRTSLNYGEMKLERVNFYYNYLHADRKAGNFFSKYALDILKHQYILDFSPNFFGLDSNWQLSYNQRYYGETYFVGNVTISKKFRRQDFNFEPFIKIDNFSNAKYSEVAGVVQPGRWIKSGLNFEW
jgi:iron complex outermembrane receptor protein